jgi:hypothetical protein
MHMHLQRAALSRGVVVRQRQLRASTPARVSSPRLGEQVRAGAAQAAVVWQTLAARLLPLLRLQHRPSIPHRGHRGCDRIVVAVSGGANRSSIYLQLALMPAFA